MSVIVTNRSFIKSRNSESTNYLLAAKDDTIDLRYRLNFNFGFTAAQNNPITVTSAGVLTYNGGSWASLGFLVGDSITIAGVSPVGGAFSVTGTVLDIQGSVLYHTATVPDAGQNYPWQDGSGSGTISVTPTVSAPEAIDVFFNLVPNSGQGSPNSLIDGEVNTIRFNTTGLAIGLSAIGTQIGNRSGGLLTTTTITRLSPLSGYAFTYEVRIVFKNWLSFEEASPNSQPWFNADNSVKPFTTNNIYRQITNPNSVLTFTDTFQLGNVGNYNQNYNQGNNPFTFTAAYTVNSQPASGIAWNAPTTVALTILKTGTFQAGYEITLINVPFTDRYKNQLTDFGQNTLMIRIINGTATVSTLSGAAWAASSISSSVATANQITINFTLTPNAALISLFDGFGTGDRWLKLSATVQTTAGSATNNDATTVLIYNAEAVTIVPVGGAADEVEIFDALDHQQNSIVTEIGAHVMTEDDVLIQSTFRLRKDRNYNAINAKIQVVRDSDGLAFDLISKSVNAANFPLTPDNKRLFNFSEPTNSQLPSPNRANTTLIFNGTETVDDYDVELNFPVLISWRYWVLKNNAFADFLDISLPQNGLNDEWVRYVESGYSFRIRFEFVRDGLVWFHNEGLNIEDYDSSADITSQIVLEDTDGNVINAIPNNGEVVVKAIHTKTTNWSEDLDDIWATNSARPFEQEPKRLISTEYPWASNNLPLQPLQGETDATKVLISPTVLVVTNRIPVGQINQNTTLIARVGTKRGDRNVHKREVPFAQLPIQAQDEDRGYKRCGEPRLALADLECCDQWKNDLYGVALIADSINVLLVDENGVEVPALGYAVSMPYQPNAVGFTIDWRQNLIEYGAGCYKVKVEYDINGFTGYYYDSNWQLYPYSVTASEGTVQLIANYNDSVKELGINFRDSGFYTGIRFKGFFGNEKINSEHNNILKANDIRVKVRNYSQPSYDLVTRPLTRCLTRPLKSILLNASDLFVSDYNAWNHEVYKYFNVILSENDGIEFEGDETFVRQLSAVMLDKNWTTESRFDGHAQPPNITEIIQCTGGGGVCPTLCQQLDGADWLEDIKPCLSPEQIEEIEDDLCDCPPPPPCPNVGGLYKSGVTTSLIANDEGATQQGDNPSFLRLDFTNCFGNDYILTGVTGGYQDIAGNYFNADGSAAASRAAAFPNEIIINHKTWKPNALTVWGGNFDATGTQFSFQNLNTAFATIVGPTFTIGSFVGNWFPITADFCGLFPAKHEDADSFDYPPMAAGNVPTHVWTGTRRTTGIIIFSKASLNRFTRGVSGAARVGAMRKFTFDPITNTLS